MQHIIAWFDQHKKITN